MRKSLSGAVGLLFMEGLALALLVGTVAIGARGAARNGAPGASSPQRPPAASISAPKATIRARSLSQPPQPLPPPSRGWGRY